jgi:hypothetical protein
MEPNRKAFGKPNYIENSKTTISKSETISSLFEIE